MNVKLSGMPELRLGLNDKVLFENTGSMFVSIVIAEYVLIMVVMKEIDQKP